MGTPPTTALIIDELNIDKGSQDPGLDKVADLKVEQTLKIARMKDVYKRQAKTLVLMGVINLTFPHFVYIIN